MFTTACGNPCVAASGSKVLKDFVPDWFTQRMLENIGPTLHGCKDGYRLISYHGRRLERLSGWLDHQGSTLMDGVAFFVSEPYYRIYDDFSEVEQFAKDLDCRLVVSEDSCHYPGHTIRLAFMPTEIDSVRGQRGCSFAGKRRKLNDE